MNKESMKFEVSAKRLRKAMERKDDIIAKDLADLSGVHKSSISQYLSGSHTPSNINAGKLAAVLGVNPVWLMGLDAPMFQPEKLPGEMGAGAEQDSLFLQELTCIANDLPGDLKERLIKYARRLSEVNQFEESEIK